MLEGPQTIAGFILETVTGTNGILVPPDGYLEGVRALCDQARHPADLRRGDVGLRPHRRVVRGRSLEGGAGHHDDGQGPDERLRAARRGGRAAGASPITSRRRCSTAASPTTAIRSAAPRRSPRSQVYEEDNLIDRAKQMGEVMRRLLDGARRRSTRASATARIIGLFGIVELVRNRRRAEPLAPFNGTRREMQALGKLLPRARGSTPSSGGTRSSPTRRCASPRRSCGRRSRSSTRP